MNYFLQGERQSGKTTLIAKIAQESGLKVCGFNSMRLINSNGDSVGFALAKYENNTSHTINIDETHIDSDFIFMSGNACNRKINLAVFDKVKTMFTSEELCDCHLFVMDELGGLELLSPIFTSFIEDILSSKIICIGTIKSETNFSHMQSMIDIQVFDDVVKAFRNKLVEVYDSKIISLTQENKVIIEREIKTEIQKYKKQLEGAQNV